MAISASCDDFADELVDTPNIIEVTVGNASAGETITVSLLGTALATSVADEFGRTVFDVPIPALAAGSYTLDFAGEGGGGDVDTLDFTVDQDALDTTRDDFDDITPPGFDPAQHWQLIDTTVDDNHYYAFARNPAKWTNPWRPVSVTHASTTAPDGNILAWQGGERAWRFEFSGYLDTQADYEALEFWCGLRRRFWLIDHRNVARFVTFEHFDAQARVVPNKPWAHDYTVKVVHFLRQGSDTEE